jgi:hypothetical protein
MLQPKKSETPTARAHLYLNYGLLGLASILAQVGYRPRVFHGRFFDPAEVVRCAIAESEKNAPILLSVPSSFALDWARQACAELRRVAPDARIIAGGRWVVADDEVWIRTQLPQCDDFVRGLAETRIEGVLRGSPGRLLVKGRAPEPVEITGPTLNYQLLDQWMEFQPSVEVSRGCGMGCSFCAEADERLTPLKRANDLAAEFERLVDHYGSTDIHPYLEASLFRPSTPWIDEFKESLSARKLQLKWRTETRVDSLSPEQVARLADAGLAVVDLGLESASPLQLERMQKTTRPEVYLRKASAVLRACKDAGVWTKVNVLLHPGENQDTLRETEEWLDAHRGYIKGVSVGPTILFRYGASSQALLHEFEKHGAHAVDSAALDRDGFAHLHLSATMSHERALEESMRISRSFMSARAYFDLKAFSYFPRGLSWPDFEAMIAATPHANYSFQI